MEQMNWIAEPNVYLESDILDLMKRNAIFTEAYNRIIGNRDLMILPPPEELDGTIKPSDVPEMILKHSNLKTSTFVIGDLYEGEVGGYKCLGVVWDYTGMILLTAG